MGKFCQNCGSELNDVQDICLGCGMLLTKEKVNTKIENKSDHSGYITSTSVIMIITGFSMIIGASDDLYDYPMLVFVIPGLLGLIAGILALNGKKNKSLLLVSGILYLIGAFINFIGIIDVSIFMILAIIFGILNIVYAREKND